MLKNYIKIAFRNLMRSKAFSLINVAGLAFGLTCAMLIGAYVYDETHYDNYAPQARNIYRVGLKSLQNTGVETYPFVDVAVGAGLKNAFPEILESTRLMNTSNSYVRYKDVQFKEERIAYADSNFLSLMGIPLLEGDEHTALVRPNSIVITKAMAEKYFGRSSGLGLELVFEPNTAYKVTGIIDKIPANTHFHYDAFISAATSSYLTNGTTWSNIGIITYVRLQAQADPVALEEKFSSIVKSTVLPEWQRDMGGVVDANELARAFRFFLTPVTDIHLHSATKYEQEANGDIQYVFIFSVLGVFIILLACINFTNLSTANSARRSREVGIRKALGSFKKQLINQFLMESVLLSLTAVVFALGFVLAALPLFNELTAKSLTASFFVNPFSLGVILLAGIMIGLIAGSYPAFFLSSFDTIRVLKGNSGSAPGKSGRLRSGLVVFQFAISTSLIIATIVVWQQLHFMQNMKLGYDKDQIIVLESSAALKNDSQAFKEKLLQDPRVSGVSITPDAPIRVNGSFYGTEINAKGSSNVLTIHTNIFSIDYDYVGTMGMKILYGRNFSKDFLSDSSAVVINETEMNDLGWAPENVIGQIVNRSGRREYKVVGVVADFHYATARQKIAPLMMMLTDAPGPMIIKTATKDVSGFLSDLKNRWDSANTGVPLEYSFLDDRFEHLYESEQTTEKIFIVFVVIAIVIACLGLYGLSAFSAEQRIKEVGIRKVLGSTVNQILFLLSKEFLSLVFIAIVIAVPASWYAMHQWLQNFGYRIVIDGWIFLIAALVAAMIALLTVSYQAVRAATADPVKSLRQD